MSSTHSILIAAAVLAASVCSNAAAQTPTLLNGQKVLLDKNGKVMVPPALVNPFPAAPLVGGADSCVTPDVLVGAGPYAFDNTVATTGTEGQNEALCLSFATTGITNDVWFTWTATATATFEFSMCGQAAHDSRLAVYPGNTCPATGTALACDDDACLFAGPSQVVVNVTSGSQYVIQIGNYPSALGGTGTFTINQFVPTPIDDCQAPGPLAGPGTYAFDTTTATNSAVAAACAGQNQDHFYSYPATTNGSATITTCGLITSAYTDSVISIYDGNGCPTAAAIACNDDACGLQTTVSWGTVCGQTYTIRLGSFGAAALQGSFNISEVGTACGPTHVNYCFGDGTGTACPCGNTGAAGNGCASSVNANGANLAASGISSLTNDTLLLAGSGMPNANCLYFQGTTQISTGFGDGLRCAGGVIVRLGTKLNAAGASQYPAGGDASVHIRGQVAAPGTRAYQVWYRNAAAFCTPSTFNLSNGVLVTWLP